MRHLLLACLLLSCFSSRGASYGAGAVVSTVAELDARIPIPTSPSVKVMGYYGTNGPLLEYAYNAAASTNPPNRAAIGGGAWVLLNWSGEASAFGVSSNIADNSSMLQQALNYSYNYKLPVKLPAGSIAYSTTLTMTNGVGIIGSGPEQSELVWNGTSGAALIIGDTNYAGATSTTDRWLFQDFAIVGKSNALPTYGVRLRGVSALTFERVRVAGFTDPNTNSVAFVADNYCWDITIRKSSFNGNNNAIVAYANGVGGRNVFNNSLITENVIRQNDYAIDIGDTRNLFGSGEPASFGTYVLTISANSIEDNRQSALRLGSVSTAYVYGNYFEDNPNAVIVGNTNWTTNQFNQTHNVQIFGNRMEVNTNSNPSVSALYAIDLQGGTGIEIAANRFSGYNHAAWMRSGFGVYNGRVSFNHYQPQNTYPRWTNSFSSWNSFSIIEPGISTSTGGGETNVNNIRHFGSTNYYETPIVLDSQRLYFATNETAPHRPFIEFLAGSTPELRIGGGAGLRIDSTATYGTVIPLRTVRTGDSNFRLQLAEDSLFFGDGAASRDVGIWRLSAGIGGTSNEWRHVLASSTAIAYSLFVSGESNIRLYELADGTRQYGSGSAVFDLQTYRAGPGVFGINSGSSGAAVELQEMGGIVAPITNRSRVWMRGIGSVEDLVWTDSSGNSVPWYVYEAGANMTASTNSATHVVTLNASASGGTNNFQLGVDGVIVNTPNLDSAAGDIKYTVADTNIAGIVGTNAITSGKIAPSQILSNHIASGQVTIDKIAAQGNTTNFLRADGTWAVPPGGSGSTEVLEVNDTPLASPWKFTNDVSAGNILVGTNSNGDIYHTLASTVTVSNLVVTGDTTVSNIIFTTPLLVASGGTGRGSLTNNALVVGAGTNALNTVGPVADRLVGWNASGAPQPVTPGTGLAYTNGVLSVTVTNGGGGAQVTNGVFDVLSVYGWARFFVTNTGTGDSETISQLSVSGHVTNVTVVTDGGDPSHLLISFDQNRDTNYMVLYETAANQEVNVQSIFMDSGITNRFKGTNSVRVYQSGNTGSAAYPGWTEILIIDRTASANIAIDGATIRRDADVISVSLTGVNSSAVLTNGQTWTTNYFEIPGVFSQAYGSATLLSAILILNQDAVPADGEINFATQPITIGNAGTAVDVTFTDAPYLLPPIPFTALDFDDTGTNRILTLSALDRTLMSTTNSTSLFGFIVARGDTTAYTQTNIPVLNLGILRD